MIAKAPLVLDLSADLRQRTWQFFREGVEASWLYQNGAHGPAAAFCAIGRARACPSAGTRAMSTCSCSKDRKATPAAATPPAV